MVEIATYAARDPNSFTRHNGTGMLEPVCIQIGCPDCDDLDIPPDTCKQLHTKPYNREEWVSPIGRTHAEAAAERSGRTLDAKLRTFDAYADKARDELVRLLTDEWEYVKRMAAGRHANGHFLYGDSLMYEYEQPRLLVEAVEELADGVNYTVLRLYRDLA